MFSLEKRGFEDDSGDSLARLTEMFLGSKAAHKTMISQGAAPAGMDRQESQSNWPNMRKTLGKPGFTSGEDRKRTFGCFLYVFGLVRKVQVGGRNLAKVLVGGHATCTNPLQAWMCLFRFGPTHDPQTQVLPSWHLVLVSVAIPS
jgi:hypothetical protein